MGKNKKKRNRDSEDSGSGLTPPSKTTVNMAASQQQQQTFSQLLNQAHESYLSPHASFNGSPNQFQSNNTTYPVNPAPNVMHPQIFQPQHIPACHSTPAPAMQYTTAIPYTFRIYKHSSDFMLKHRHDEPQV